MKVLYYQCFSGISGDMNLGAMVDLGVPEDYLRKELAKLHVDDEYNLVVTRGQKQGITGTRADVILTHHHEEGSKGAGHGSNHESRAHDYNAAHGDYSHNHSHAHSRSHGDHHHDHEGHTHNHRGLSVITGIIRASDLSETVKERSVAIFTALAEAEAHIHGMSVEDVHFHEVGATDAIVDIVGAAISLDYLDVEKVYCSPVEVGGGFTECAHGRFPVPAPATARILRDIPLTFGTVDGESATPTGAAILKTVADEFVSHLQIRPSKIGYGIGHRDFSIPNVLRAVIGDCSEEKRRPDEKQAGFSAEYEQDVNEVIESDLDDMVPEDFGALRSRLLEGGALDVVFLPVFMKNDRPGTRVSVLCGPERTVFLTELLFALSTTAGVRVCEVKKVMLPREIRKVDTSFGPVAVKILRRPSFEEESDALSTPGGTENKKLSRSTWKAEYRDLLKIANTHHLSVPEVRERLRNELNGKL